MKAILLDIEGTTTPISFVHDVLFPFARKRIHDYVAENFDELSAEIEEVRREYDADDSYSSPLDPSSVTSVANYLAHLIDADRKSTPLKSIQGKIWKDGYESGELKSIVYDDVPRAFERWRSKGKKIAIYSSGSVLAQRLLFRHTDHGDLTGYISDYFDTNIGGKREAASYAKIAAEINIASEEIMFCSDVVEELNAAQSSHILTALIVRPGNVPIGESFGHPVSINFDSL